jgi:hypothetical protein
VLANDHGEEPTIVGNTEPLHGSLEGVQLPGGSFGSWLAPVPGHLNEFFGLEDRGPNVESPLTTPTQTINVLPEPSYDPSIARFSFEDGEAELVETIPLRDSSNSEITALSNNTFLIDERDSGFPSATGYKKLWEVNLEADHIKPVSATLYLDIDQLLTQLNPTDAFFDHDKVEGVSALEGGKRIVISNDNDGHDQRERSALSPEVSLT